jgi:hypothetical protein
MITHTQAVRLLAYLAAFDQRPFDETAPDVWMDVAADRRWTYDEAMDAVRALVLDPAPRARRIGPAEVAEVIRQRRNEAIERREAEEARARRDALRVVDPETVAARRATIAAAVRHGPGTPEVPEHVGSDAMDGLYAAQGWSQTRRLSLRYPCPHCDAEVGRGCVVRARRPRPLREPHPSRAALTVECPTCAAAIGATCEPADEHPHHTRDVLVIGPQGLAARQLAVTDAKRPSERPVLATPVPGFDADTYGDHQYDEIEPEPTS